MSLGYSQGETETNPSNKNRFAWVCLAFVGGFCVGLGFFLWVGFGFFNKAMEYYDLEHLLKEIIKMQGEKSFLYKTYYLKR